MPTHPVEDEQGVVDVLFVVAVVEGAFLISVGGIIGGIEIQHYPFRDALLASLFEVELEDGLGYPVARASGGSILKARDCRLACQRRYDRKLWIGNSF